MTKSIARNLVHSYMSDISQVLKAALGWVYGYPNLTFNLPNILTGYAKAG
jgi:hypothetical protein